MYPDARIWGIASQAELRIVRIGGTASDQYMPPNEMLSGWVNAIKAMGAEPMIQVSHFNGAEAAAEVASTNKPIAAAMKAVDPTIKIFAPDECDFYDAYYAALLRGDDSATDISGKVPGQNYYYNDGVSWHRHVGYTPENIEIERLTTAGANDYLVTIQKTRALIDKVNTARGRLGTDALQWGIGEFNSSEGRRVGSFENGQMFAEVYGYIMKYGGTYGATWSMYENGGKCFGTDYGFVDAKNTATLLVLSYANDLGEL